MRTILTVWVGILLALSAPAARAQAQLGGYLKFYDHTNTAFSQSISKIGVRLQMNLTKSFGDLGELFSSFDFDANDLRFYQNGFDRRGAELEVYPVEAYLSFYFPMVDVRLGKQFIFWGKADWINPTDNINPWDYANISSEIEDYRLPVTALKTNWYLGPVTLEADWIPVFLPHRVPLPRGLLQMGMPDRGVPAIVAAPPVLPAPTFKHSQAAFRLQHSVWGIDYSFSFYSGFDHQFSLISSQDATQITLTPEYKPLRVFGGDFQKIFGRWGVKGEAAYFRTADPNGINPEIANPHIQYVLGNDWTVSDRLSVTVQWVQTIQEKFNARLEEAAARRNPLHPEVPEKVTSSVSGVLKWNPLNYMTSQLIGVVNLRDRDSFILGFLSYEPADAIRLTLGGLFFSGPAQSPFGRMDNEDKIFLEVKYSY